MTRPRRVLMTLDAVGGVWRYAVDLASGLDRAGIGCVLAGVGPPPGAAATGGLPDTELVWTGETLDWMAEDEAILDSLPDALVSLARAHRCDLLHLNLPSQAAGLPNRLPGGLPVLVASHSCVPTWWDAVRATPLPQHWAWQRRRNRRGLDRADHVLAPSASHAAALARSYGPVERLSVVRNATDGPCDVGDKEPFVLAAGRWWDEAKNAATLDRAARASPWPVRLAGSLCGPDGQRVPVLHAEALGALPPAAMLGLMRRAAIFAAASLYEPFGLAVLEAAGQGAALVLSDIPTFRELWEGAALFVPAMDHAGFAAAIATLAADAGQRRELGRRAARIACGLTPARQLEGVIAGYGEAMTRGAG